MRQKIVRGEIDELVKDIGNDLQGHLGPYRQKGYLSYPYDASRIIDPHDFCYAHVNQVNNKNHGDYYRLFRKPGVLISGYTSRARRVNPRLSKKLFKVFDLEKFIRESVDFRSLFIPGHSISEYLTDMPPNTLIRVARSIGQEERLKRMLEEYRRLIKKSERSIECSWDCGTAPF